jgi:Spy/CpxP family protein refolding chaperone
MPISAIDSIVKLTDDEKTKIEAIQATYKTDVAAAIASGDQQKRRDAGTKASEDIRIALTPEQATKFTETVPAASRLSQTRAVPIAVLAAVKLTDEQWTKIKAAEKIAADKIAAAAQGADRQTARTEANMEFKTTVDALLTAEQKEIIAKAPAPGATPAAPAPATKVL